MNIILIGFKNSGKTTIGKKLAEVLNYSFIDTDDLMTSSYQQMRGKQQTSRQIYQAEGEMKFRELEKNAIATLTGTKNAIIATGGGSILNPESVKILKQLGTIIYLFATKEFLLERNKSHQTAAFLNENNPEKSFEQLYKARKDIYENVANYLVQIADKTVDEIVQEIIALCKKSR